MNLYHINTGDEIMSRTRMYISNKSIIYLIAIVVLVALFALLEGWSGARDMIQRVEQLLGLVNWKWTQIIISLLIGFLLGLGINRRN